MFIFEWKQRSKKEGYDCSYLVKYGGGEGLL